MTFLMGTQKFGRKGSFAFGLFLIAGAACLRLLKSLKFIKLLMFTQRFKILFKGTFDIH